MQVPTAQEEGLIMESFDNRFGRFSHPITICGIVKRRLQALEMLPQKGDTEDLTIKARQDLQLAEAAGKVFARKGDVYALKYFEQPIHDIHVVR